MEPESTLSTVLPLYRDNNWRDILKLNEDSKSQAAISLLWVWPSEDNLEYIKSNVIALRLEGVISIGCGCGLFEWILQQYSGLSVLGCEANKPWWESKYSNPLFIPHTYPELPITESTLNPKYALLFCYFNDGDAFIDYVDHYKGDLIFIIGPGEGRGTHTDPEPFKPHFGNSRWRLYGYQEVKDSKDFIAVYRRDNLEE